MSSLELGEKQIVETPSERHLRGIRFGVAVMVTILLFGVLAAFAAVAIMSGNVDPGPGILIVLVIAGISIAVGYSVNADSGSYNHEVWDSEQI